jgi:hypothetical protein
MFELTSKEILVSSQLLLLFHYSEKLFSHMGDYMFL